MSNFDNDIMKQAMSELGKRSAAKNKGKRDYSAMGKKGMEKRWGKGDNKKDEQQS